MKLNSKLGLCSCIGMMLTVSAHAAEPTTTYGAEVIGGPVEPVIINVDMKSLPRVTQWRPGDPVKDVPKQTPPGWEAPAIAPSTFTRDPLLGLQDGMPVLSGGSGFDTPILNFAGSNFVGGNPSDTVGTVGNNYYVQMVNATKVLIFDKNTGVQAIPTFDLDSLAAGSGTNCTSGSGDPIILFDETVDNGPGNDPGRWVLTEFTGSGFCVYISQDDDPTAGNWYVYQFNSASGGLPDYPKYGVWHDAYYIGANESLRHYALDRENMLQGLTARPLQVFQGAPALAGFGFQVMQPADWDGDLAPPASMPGLFLRHRDDEVHNAGSNDPTKDFLEIWEFDVDWDTPANSSFTGPITIDIAEIESELCGLTAFACVPMPGTGTELDPLREPVMQMAQYRNFGTHQTLVGSLVTDTVGGSADVHGVRWFELRNTGAGWTLFQEGTYSPDTVNRWMSSAAMDQSGNIAIGYNVSDATSVYPGMRYVGRLATDPAGTTPRGEFSIIEGDTANGSNRWGDYSQISVDPIDECTFWYTAQHNTGSSLWKTQIASFKFDACGCDLALDTLTAGASVPGDNEIEITFNDSTVAGISEYQIYRSTTSGSGYVLIDTVVDSSPGTGGGSGYTYTDTTVSGGIEYFYVVRSSDGGACVSDPSNEVSATATGVCTLAPAFSGLVSTSNTASATCSISLDWASGASSCPSASGDLTYNVYRSTSSGFVPGVANQIATGLSGTGYLDNDSALVSDTDYYYVVRAVDVDNGVEDGNSVEGMAFPTGPITPEVFDEDLEAYATIGDAEAAGWTHYADTGSDDWRVESGDDHTNGNGVAFVSTNTAATTDKSLQTKAFSPSGTSVLSFYHKHQFETNGAGTTFYDGGVLEVSLDGGNSWNDLGNDMTTGGYNATLDGGFGQPLGAVSAWGGDLASFTLVEVDLSPYNGQLIHVRWRMGTDSSVNDGDWKIDDIVITDVGTFGVCESGSDLIFYDGFNASAP